MYRTARLAKQSREVNIRSSLSYILLRDGAFTRFANLSAEANNMNLGLVYYAYVLLLIPGFLPHFG